MKNQIIETKQTYKTYANAEAALRRKLAASGRADAVRWLIAATPDGRFAPVVVGVVGNDRESNVGFAHVGITVVG